VNGNPIRRRLYRSPYMSFKPLLFGCHRLAFLGTLPGGPRPQAGSRSMAPAGAAPPSPAPRSRVSALPGDDRCRAPSQIYARPLHWTFKTFAPAIHNGGQSSGLDRLRWATMFVCRSKKTKVRPSTSSTHARPTTNSTKTSCATFRGGLIKIRTASSPDHNKPARHTPPHTPQHAACGTGMWWSKPNSSTNSTLPHTQPVGLYGTTQYASRSPYRAFGLRFAPATSFMVSPEFAPHCLSTKRQADIVASLGTHMNSGEPY
jgi:hypothetical protein